MQAKTWGPFTGRQLTTIIGFLCAAVVLLPGAVWAVDSFSNVAIEDPVSGKKAAVDANRNLKISDGSGALTVDGTVKALPTKSAKFFAARDFAPLNSNLHLSSTGFAVTSITFTNTGGSSDHATVGYSPICSSFLQIFDFEIPAQQTVHVPFPQVFHVPALPGCGTTPYISLSSVNGTTNATVLGYDY